MVLRLVTVRTPVGLSRTANDKPLIICKVTEKTLNRKLTYLEPLQCPGKTCTPPSSSSSPSSFNGGTRDKRHPMTRIFAMLSSTSIQLEELDPCKFLHYSGCTTGKYARRFQGRNPLLDTERHLSYNDHQKLCTCIIPTDGFSPSWGSYYTILESGFSQI